MTKKILIGMLITVLLGAGVFGLVQSTYAQSTDTPGVEETTPVETGAGVCAINGEPVQTRTRQQLNINEGTCDGTCTGEGDPLQTRTRQQLNINEGNCDGTCTGEGLPQQSRMGQGGKGK